MKADAAERLPTKRTGLRRVARICALAGAGLVILVAALWAYVVATRAVDRGRVCDSNLRAIYLLGGRLWPGKQPRDWGRIEDLAEHYRATRPGLITDEEYRYLSGGRGRKNLPARFKREFLRALASSVPWVCPSHRRAREAGALGAVMGELPPSYQWKPVVGILAKCPIHHLQLLDSGDVREGP